MFCGRKSIEGIHFHAELSKEGLQKYLELPNKIPGSDTTLRILAGIDGKELEEILIKDTWEVFGSDMPEKEVVAIDRKTIRNSRYTNFSDEEKSHKTSHEDSAFASSMGICFGRVKSEVKRNHGNSGTPKVSGFERRSRYD